MRCPTCIVSNATEGNSFSRYLTVNSVMLSLPEGEPFKTNTFILASFGIVSLF